jgi:hypothetical protein
MSDQSDTSAHIAAAISGAKQRAERAQHQVAEEQQRQSAAAAQQRENMTRWGNIKVGTILPIVKALGDVAVRQASPILIEFIPGPDPLSVGFKLHRSGEMETLTTLQFTMAADGFVSVRCRIPGIDVWAPKPLVQVDEAWVQEVTTKVFEGAPMQWIR